MKRQVLHTLLRNVSGEAAGEIWNWSLSGVESRLGASLAPNFGLFSVWFSSSVSRMLPIAIPIALHDYETMVAKISFENCSFSVTGNNNIPKSCCPRRSHCESENATTRHGVPALARIEPFHSQEWSISNFPWGLTRIIKSHSILFYP